MREAVCQRFSDVVKESVIARRTLDSRRYRVLSEDYVASMG